MFGIRPVMGNLILLIDRLTRPRAPDRSFAMQAELDRQTAGLALYAFRA